MISGYLENLQPTPTTNKEQNYPCLDLIRAIYENAKECCELAIRTEEEFCSCRAIGLGMKAILLNRDGYSWIYNGLMHPERIIDAHVHYLNAFSHHVEKLDCIDDEADRTAIISGIQKTTTDYANLLQRLLREHPDYFSECLASPE